MISLRITYLRKRSGMSQAKLASILNLSPSTIGMYEQDRRIPALETLVSMSKIFGVSLDYLITGSEYNGSSDNSIYSSIAEDCPCCSCYWKKYIVPQNK